MPTLPYPPEPPAGPAEKIGDAMRRVGAAVGVDARVNVRVLVFLAMAALGASMAPAPWAQIALVSLIGLALDWARKRA